MPSGTVTSDRRGPNAGNARNPELDDVLVRSNLKSPKERDLPALPAAKGDAVPRTRPSRSPSANGVSSALSTPGKTPLKQNPFGLANYGSGATPQQNGNRWQLIDFGGGPSSTRPLQVDSSGSASGNGYGQNGFGGLNGQAGPSVMPHFNTGNPFYQLQSGSTPQAPGSNGYFSQQSQSQSQNPNQQMMHNSAIGFNTQNPFLGLAQQAQSPSPFHASQASPFSPSQQQQQHQYQQAYPNMPQLQHHPHSFPLPIGQSSMINANTCGMNGSASMGEIQGTQGMSGMASMSSMGAGGMGGMQGQYGNLNGSNATNGQNQQQMGMNGNGSVGGVVGGYMEQQNGHGGGWGNHQMGMGMGMSAGHGY